eukprot:gene5449-2380_t
MPAKPIPRCTRCRQILPPALWRNPIHLCRQCGQLLGTDPTGPAVWVKRRAPRPVRPGSRALARPSGGCVRGRDTSAMPSSVYAPTYSLFWGGGDVAKQFGTRQGARRRGAAVRRCYSRSPMPASPYASSAAVTSAS